MGQCCLPSGMPVPLTRLDVLSHVLPSLLSVCADGRHLGVLIIVDGESDAFTSVPSYIIHMYSYSALTTCRLDVCHMHTDSLIS